MFFLSRPSDRMKLEVCGDGGGKPQKFIPNCGNKTSDLLDLLSMILWARQTFNMSNI